MTFRSWNSPYGGSGLRGRLPVSGERSQGEHGDPHGGELDEGDQLAADAPEQPLVHQVAAGVHRGAGHQQQQIPQSQAGQEQVGHRAHGLHQQTRLHQSDIPDQTHQDDEPVNRSDSDAREPDGVLVTLRAGVPEHLGDIEEQSFAVLQRRSQLILQGHRGLRVKDTDRWAADGFLAAL